MSYCYIIQTREADHMKGGVYKIGYTDRVVDKSKKFRGCKVIDCFITKDTGSMLVEWFDKIFERVKEYGRMNEYGQEYTGNVEQMKIVFQHVKEGYNFDPDPMDVAY